MIEKITKFSRSLKNKAALMTLIVALTSLSFSSTAATIAYFNNSAFVDMAGGCFSEGIQFELSMEALGHTVNPFTDFSAAGLTTALIGAEVLAFPELENGNLAFALTPAAITVISDFVNGGGGLLVGGGTFFGGGTDGWLLLNTLFGFSLANGGDLSTGFSNLDATDALGTPFEGGPAVIPNNSGTHPLGGTFPTGMLSIYQNSPISSTVALIPVGTGSIAYLGWDWFNGGPGCAAESIAWNDVLDFAILAVAGDFVPPPPPPPPAAVPTMGQWGLILLSLIMVALGGATMMRRQTSLAMANGTGSFRVKTPFLPFNKESYPKTLLLTFLAIASIFGVAIAFFGYELTNADIPGSLLAVPVLAYIINLFQLEVGDKS